MINAEGFRKLVEKQRKIGEYISAGKEIPYELRKNFVSFPLHDEPFRILDVRRTIGGILEHIVKEQVKEKSNERLHETHKAI